MPITTHREPSRDLTTFLVDGLMYFDEMQKAIKRFYENLDPPPTKNILWDLRNAKADNLRSKEAEELAFFVTSIDKRKEIGKTAIVAPNDLVYGVSRIFVAHIRNPDIQFNLFRDIDEATKWFEEK